MFAGDDPTPWELLRDGSIDRVERDLADTVTLWLDLPYVRSRFADDGDRILVRLVACTHLVYTPLDEPPLTTLAEIAASGPSLGTATWADGLMHVRGGAGTLEVCYDRLRLELDAGREVSVDELRRVVDAAARAD